MSSEPITVYIRDLPFSAEGDNVKKECDEDLILTYCGQYANIDPLKVTIRLKNNFNGAPVCYGFIQVRDQKELDKLFDKLNFKKVNKKPMHLIVFDEATQNVIRNEEGRALIIKNFNSDILVSDLYNTFGAFGDIIDCEIPNDSSKTAYVLFRDTEGPKLAIQRLNGTNLNGREPVQIELDHQNTFAKLFVLPGAPVSTPAPVEEPATPAPVEEPAAPAPAEEPAAPAPIEEPAAPVEEPVAPVLEPVTPAPEPIAPTPEPVVPISEPVAPTVEPVAPIPEPAPIEEPAEPEPVDTPAQEEEPIGPVEEPAPLADEPVPIEEPCTPGPIEEPAPELKEAVPIEPTPAEEPIPVADSESVSSSTALAKENERLARENQELKAKLAAYEKQSQN